MKIRMGKLIVIVILFILFLPVFPVHAQSTLALQEKCAEEAKKLIDDSNEVADSHYNRKLDKCFMRVTSNFGRMEFDMKGKKGKTIKQRLWMDSLVNVFENKFIGVCVYVFMEMKECWVENTECKTFEEFKNLIRPYMED